MRILVLFGGESVEHEISVITANQVMNALSVGYSVIPCYISKENKMYHLNKLLDLNIYKNINEIINKKNEIKIGRKNKKYYLKKKLKKKIYFDMAFPVVHGKGVEDSTLLSYLKFKKIPVISDSLSFYAIAQNKSMTKRILNSLNINNSKFIEIDRQYDIQDIENLLEYPLIVKPNTLGSSIGINKANNRDELIEAINVAFSYDKNVIVEEYIEKCKEYNISVVEKKGEIITSSIEEVLSSKDILDYSQKYEGGEKVNGMVSSKRIFPAPIDEKIKEEIENTAKLIYKSFEAKGVIRIDFLYQDKVYVNEINSIPGSYSYYLWKDKMDFLELLDCVIDSSKRDYYYENKLLKSIEKLNIFNNLTKNNKLKG